MPESGRIDQILTETWSPHKIIDFESLMEEKGNRKKWNIAANKVDNMP